VSKGLGSNSRVQYKKRLIDNVRIRLTFDLFLYFFHFFHSYFYFYFSLSFRALGWAENAFFLATTLRESIKLVI